MFVGIKVYLARGRLAGFDLTQHVCDLSLCYLQEVAQLGGEALFLQVFHHGFAPEQIDGHPWGQEALVLLPLQRLEESDKDEEPLVRESRQVTK